MRTRTSTYTRTCTHLVAVQKQQTEQRAWRGLRQFQWGGGKREAMPRGERMIRAASKSKYYTKGGQKGSTPFMRIRFQVLALSLFSSHSSTCVCSCVCVCVCARVCVNVCVCVRVRQ